MTPLKIFRIKNLIDNPIFLSLINDHPCLIPDNFDWKTYINNYTDLRDIHGFSTEIEAKLHYILFGKKEQRNYQIAKVSKYPNIDPKIYKILNLDLSILTDEEAILHFIEHGKKEKRKYKCDFSYETIIQKTKNINLKKTDILLINHDTSLTGAPKALQNIYNHIIENKRGKPLYVDVVPDKKININNIVYHINNYNTINNIIDKTEPSIILSNSLNIYLKYIDKFYNLLNKTIFYIHETYDVFKQFGSSVHCSLLKNAKIFVVSDKIKEEFIQNGFNQVFVSPPFIPITEQQKIDILKLKPINKIKNISNSRVINKKRTIVGMCGTMDDRKNFPMFCEIARSLKNIEFVWIGGDVSAVNKRYKNISNLFVIKQTNNPYKYFEILDYFFLTSKSDPCPFVVLENLYMNKKIIVLDKNIHYDHNSDCLENYTILKNHQNDPKIIINKLKNLKLDKCPNKTQKNINYIKNNFSDIKIILDDID